MTLDNRYYLWKTDSIISIKYKSMQEFQYMAENSETIVTYLSNIGGLIPLCFGLAFIDLETIIKYFFTNIRFFLIQELHLDKIIKILKSLMIKQFLTKLFQLIHYMEVYNWRKTLTIGSIPLLIIQFYQLIHTYLQFLTVVSVEIIPYRDTDKTIGFNSMPAITVCEENIFDLMINDKKMTSLFTKIRDQKMNNTLIDGMIYEVSYNVYAVNKSNANKALIQSLNEALSFNIFIYNFRFLPGDKYVDENLSELYIIDEKNNNLALIIKYFQTINKLNNYKMNFCEIFLANNTISSEISTPCLKISTQITIVSPFGKCFTFFYNTNNFEDYRLKSQYLFQMVYYDQFQSKRFYYEQNIVIKYRKFIVHNANSFPTINNNVMQMTQTGLEKTNSFAILINMVKFKKLKYPYETNCLDYGYNELFDCLNKCYHDKYLNELKCVPFFNGLFTFENTHDSLKKYKFCTNYTSNSFNDIYLNNLSSKLKFKCSLKCGTPCTETHYSSKYQEMAADMRSYFRFFLSHSYYLNIIYSPKTVFYSLIINIANICSLWYGISFVQLINILLRSQTKRLFLILMKKLKKPKLFSNLRVSNLLNI